MKRVLQVAVLLVALLGAMGCAAIVDFFESGFADGDGGGPGDGGGNDTLTLEALEGDWSLDRDISTVVLIATWDARSIVDTADFLDGAITTPGKIAKVRIAETTLEFLDADGDLLAPQFTYAIPAANTIHLTSGATVRDLTTDLDPSGTLLTLSDGTTDIIFDIDADTLGITEYTLHITQDQFNTSIIFSDDSPQDITETLRIVDSGTIELTEGTTPINVKATLSDSDTILRLIFPSNATHDRSGTAVFTKE